jgi:hypothetical protein
VAKRKGPERSRKTEGLRIDSAGDIMRTQNKKAGPVTIQPFPNQAARLLEQEFHTKLNDPRIVGRCNLTKEAARNIR